MLARDDTPRRVASISGLFVSLEWWKMLRVPLRCVHIVV